jgi:hypothetical protein
VTPQTQPAKRTRAEAIRAKVVVRLATNEMGPQIAAVLKASGIEPDVDWKTVFPHWLIACDGDDVIGVVMVMPAKPFGFLHFLHVDPKAPFKLRVIAIQKLMTQALGTLKMYGSSQAVGFIDGSNKKFADILGKLGAVALSSGALITRKL